MLPHPAEALAETSQIGVIRCAGRGAGAVRGAKGRSEGGAKEGILEDRSTPTPMRALRVRGRRIGIMVSD